jgi:hypothetical protein
MTEFQVVVKGRVCSAFHNCVHALAVAQQCASSGRPAAVRMLVVRGSYRSLTTLWPEVGPTESNRRYPTRLPFAG